MTPKISYLVQSKTGFFEYRRRVPPTLQKHFPRSSKGKLLTEWKKALDTKIESVAQRRWVAENERFEATKRKAEELLHGEVPKTQPSNQSAISSAKQMAVKYGVHPDQAPTLGVDATNEQIQNFPQKIKEWKLKVQEHEELLLDFILDEYIDEEQRAKDYQSGRWGEYGYQTPYKPSDPNDPLIAQYLIVSGETKVTSHATWSDAAELYIKTNIEHQLNNDIMLGHFGNLKGTNKFKHVSALIVASRPAINPRLAERAAAVISWQNIQELDGEQVWYPRERSKQELAFSYPPGR